MTTQQAATQIRRILADPDSPITQQMLRDWLEALERTEKLARCARNPRL